MMVCSISGKWSLPTDARDLQCLKDVRARLDFSFRRFARVRPAARAVARESERLKVLLGRLPDDAGRLSQGEARVSDSLAELRDQAFRGKGRLADGEPSFPLAGR